MRQMNETQVDLERQRQEYQMRMAQVVTPLLIQQALEPLLAGACYYFNLSGSTAIPTERQDSRVEAFDRLRDRLYCHREKTRMDVAGTIPILH